MKNLFHPRLVGIGMLLMLTCFTVSAQEKALGDFIPISGNYQYALIKNKKENKAKSGTLVVNQWSRRDFNELTVLGSTDDWVNLNNSRITLQPGIYRVQASIGAYRTHHSRIRLIEVNADGSLNENSGIYGMSVHNHPDGYTSVNPTLLTYLNLTDEKTYEIQHIVRTTNGGVEARGMNSSSQNSNDTGDETYGWVEVIQFTQQ